MRTSPASVFAASLIVLAAPGLAAAEDVVYTLSKADYANKNTVSQAVQNECYLPLKLVQFIQQSTQGSTAIETVEQAPTKGRFLKVEILNVEGAGGGAWSGPKSVTIGGSLLVNGKPTASFTARRISGGGAFGGFKGTCDILGRNVKALGQDVANWLSNPVDGARLGNL